MLQSSTTIAYHVSPAIIICSVATGPDTVDGTRTREQVPGAVIDLTAAQMLLGHRLVVPPFQLGMVELQRGGRTSDQGIVVSVGTCFNKDYGGRMGCVVKASS